MSTVLSCRANVFNRDNSVGTFGHDSTRRDGHSLACFEPPTERRACGGLADDAQGSRQVGRTHGESVHRRARKRRQVDARPHVVGADAAARGGNRHALHGKPTDVSEHALLRLLETE